MEGVMRRITVELPKKSYEFIRRRVDADQKTSRALSRYLFTFFTVLADGEQSLFRTFSQAEARRLATILDAAHHADEVPWEELCIFSGTRLGALVGLYAPNETLIISKVSALGAFEIIALMEYAQTLGAPELFARQTARFRG